MYSAFGNLLNVPSINGMYAFLNVTAFTYLLSVYRPGFLTKTTEVYHELLDSWIAPIAII